MSPIDLFGPIKEYIMAQESRWIKLAESLAKKNFTKI